jgi:hypothetical protein
MIRIGIATRDLFVHFAATRARSLGATPIPATPQPAGPPRRLSDVVEQLKEVRGTNVQFTETFLVEDMADQERQTLYAASFVFRPEHPAQQEELLVDRILWVIRRQAINGLNVPNPHVCLWDTHEKKVLDAPLTKEARSSRDLIEKAMGDRIFYVKKEETEMRLKLDPQWCIGDRPAYPEDTSIRVKGTRYFYLDFDDPIVQQSLAGGSTAQDAAMAALEAMHAPSEAPAAAAVCAASSTQK